MTEKNTKEKGVITIKKDDIWKYSTFALIAVVVILLIVFLAGQNITGNVINTPGGNLPPAGERVTVQTGDAPVLGDANAPVTFVEFTDYFCPFCQRHALETKPLIKSNFVDSGEVKYVMMNFLRVSPDAANAALCAREVGGDDVFWSYNDALFAAGPQALNQATYVQIANTLGIGGDEFVSCMDSGKYNSLIQQQTTHAQSIGVSGTPGFFINGRAISGACPYSTFSQAIEAEKAGRSWRVTSCQFALA
jgi:protein-disulfide isomerase